MQYAQLHCCQCQQHHRHQYLAVSEGHALDNTFPSYLQTQLANWRPFDNQQHPPHPHQSLPSQAYSVQVGHQQATMDAKLAVSGHLAAPAFNEQLPNQQSYPSPYNNRRSYSFQSASEHGHTQPEFFNDNFHYHRPQEAALYNPQYHQHQLHHWSHNVPTVPAMSHLAPHGLPHRISTESLRKDVSLAPPLSPLTRWVTNVDTSQYEIIGSEDLKRGSFAAFDEDDDTGTSPTTVDTNSSGPFTPAGSDFGSFDAPQSRTWTEMGSSFGSQASDMFSLSHGLPYHPVNHLGERKYSATDHMTGPTLSASGPVPLGQSSTQYMSKPLGSYPITDANIPRTITTATLRDLHRIPVIDDIEDPPNANVANVSAIADISAQEEEEYTKAVEDRRRKDDYLLSMRNRGYSYREIKRRGKFREAESTLRGRVRVLTKDKSERVRRPEWTEGDVRLLHRAIAHHQKRMELGKQGRARDGKLPWKRISVWIKEHGGSYLFAPATCAKKWEEVEESDEE
ncbi:hypothetical protein LTR95_007330 [Oleoguttula sp. CCFEE 5521]